MSEENNSQQNGAANFIQNTPDTTAEYDPADIEKNKTISALAYILFFLPLVACPESKFGRFHANQGLVLLLFSIVGGIVISILYGILIWVFYPLAALINAVFYLAVLALVILGIVNTFNGKAKELPVIGKIKLIK